MILEFSLTSSEKKNWIFNPYAAWDEFSLWVVSRFGGDDGLAVTVSVVEGLGEPGAIRFSLSYFFTEVEHQSQYIDDGSVKHCWLCRQQGAERAELGAS